VHSSHIIGFKHKLFQSRSLTTKPQSKDTKCVPSIKGRYAWCRMGNCRESLWKQHNFRTFFSKQTSGYCRYLAFQMFVLLFGIHLSTSIDTYNELNAHKVSVEQHWVKSSTSPEGPLGPSCKCMCEFAPHPWTVSILMEFRKICIAILPGYTQC